MQACDAKDLSSRSGRIPGSPGYALGVKLFSSDQKELKPQGYLSNRSPVTKQELERIWIKDTLGLSRLVEALDASTSRYRAR